MFLHTLPYLAVQRTMIAMSKPTLYLMLGYPGAGKTTAAKVIAELTGAVHLWADHERRERYGQPTYHHAENIDLYSVLNEETAQLLNQGQSVVFDTGFNFYRDREHLRRIAENSGAQTQLVWVTTRRQLAKERATSRAHLQPTRLLGNFTDNDFERISDNLEPPHQDETYVQLDGTKITHEYVAQQLNLGP